MTAWMSLRRMAAAVSLLAGLAVGALPAAGLEVQEGSPQNVAGAWARKMIQTLRTHDRRDEAGNLVALQPLHPGTFHMLTARQRRQLYEWLLHAFGDSALDRYSLVDPVRLRDIARALEETGAADWEKRYHAVLENASARINIICTGRSGAVAINLSCVASDLKSTVSLGRAPVSFRLAWLNEPVALELAVRSFAEAVVRQMERRGTLEAVSMVDRITGSETRLPRYIAGLLEDAIHERMRSYGGSRPVGTGGEKGLYAVEGEVEVGGRRRAMVRVAIKVGERRMGLGRENVVVPEHFGAEGGESPKGADPAKVFLPDGYTLADWVLLAEDRLGRGDHARLLTEASRHMRKYGEMAAVVEVRDRVVTALVEAIRVETRDDARAALESIGRIEPVAGARPALLWLKARAYRRLGDYGAEAAAHVAWLQAAPQDHPQRREVVLALARAREWLSHHERFAELVGRPFSKDTAEGGVGWTDLHYAAVLDLPGVIGALVDAGMAVDTRLKGSPPRQRFGDDLQGKLATMGHEEFKDWFADGETALMLAARVKAGRAFAYLVERGADIQGKRSQVNTVLHHAAYGDSVEAAKYLVGAGADI